jgi:5'-deoxynucleotidase YfbR-like HD superfamily hydrolase
MSKVTVTMKMEKDLHKELKDFCGEKGYLIGTYVEKAVLEKLEKDELAEDISDYLSYKNDKNKVMVDFDTAKKKLGL